MYPTQKSESSMKRPSYVLVTPVRDEEATIGITLESVVNQSLLPKEWVIVSDQSMDSTEEIVRHYEKRYTFIRLLRVEHATERSFASVVHATEAGLKTVWNKDYDYLGLLDADVRFSKYYYESLIHHMVANPGLGLTGGLVLDVINGKIYRGRHYLGDVAGATQFFSRKCFESLGSLVALPEGGWDAITCFQARANGYLTATLPDLIVEHLKPRNACEGNAIRREWKNGIRDYALGGHPVFQLLKCIVRSVDHPILVGSAARMLAFTYCTVKRRERILSAETVHGIRREQVGRLMPRFFRNWVGTTGDNKSVS